MISQPYSTPSEMLAFSTVPGEKPDALVHVAGLSRRCQSYAQASGLNNAQVQVGAKHYPRDSPMTCTEEPQGISISTRKEHM